MSRKKAEIVVEQSSFRMIYSVGRYVSRRFSAARPSRAQPDAGPPLAGTIGCYPDPRRLSRMPERTHLQAVGTIPLRMVRRQSKQVRKGISEKNDNHVWRCMT